MCCHPGHVWFFAGNEPQAFNRLANSHKATRHHHVTSASGKRDEFGFHRAIDNISYPSGWIQLSYFKWKPRVGKHTHRRSLHNSIALIEAC